MNFTALEASGQVNALFGKYEAPIVSAILETEEAWQEREIAPRIFREVSSDNYAESYISITAADDWEPVGENGAHPNNGFRQGFDKTIKNTTWKTNFSISRELADDGKVTDMTQLARRKAGSFYRTRERFFAKMLCEALKGNSSMDFGGESFDISCADGNPMFYASHPPKVSGAAQSNIFKDAFSTANLFKAMTAMQNLKGDNDEILDMNPDTIIIPNIASLKADVYAAVASLQKPGTTNNDVNPLFEKVDIIVWPYLNQFLGTLSAPWLIMDSQYMLDHDCAIHQNRVPMEMKDRIGNNDEFIWDGYARFGGGFVDWRGLMACGIASASEL